MFLYSTFNNVHGHKAASQKIKIKVVNVILVTYSPEPVYPNYYNFTCCEVILLLRAGWVEMDVSNSVLNSGMSSSYRCSPYSTLYRYVQYIYSM